MRQALNTELESLSSHLPQAVQRSQKPAIHEQQHAMRFAQSCEQSSGARRATGDSEHTRQQRKNSPRESSFVSWCTQILHERQNTVEMHEVCGLERGVVGGRADRVWSWGHWREPAVVLAGRPVSFSAITGREDAQVVVQQRTRQGQLALIAPRGAHMPQASSNSRSRIAKSSLSR
eukprot:CAMPEP_0114419318 /NCGR_PEP_ID=MMETSP0103-20121206/3960_1 /TAXON_ID=37642 ORGANISM="Paraphysomonas imperforata, Strain PA2" /NCGR_SAMPLE_ID=MMETSP0103 /ASSEMBLY_ACC=CAM_ASM_000201 /LENGTH=175 /DNA_ID=CAMNT_0001587723 /DNA_START=85 /DNA_END=614 /DNA_ORIENTATION=-